jgi:hypothetical protein
MIVRALDRDGDWTCGKGRQDYRSGNDAIAQMIQTGYRSILGDCFWALEDGIDWFNLLGSRNVVGVQLAVKTMILNVEGVISLQDFRTEFSVNLRNLATEYGASTVFPGGISTGDAPLLLTESGDNLITEDGQPLAAG